jgi:hypothetical protein
MTEQTPYLTAIHVVFRLVAPHQLGVNPIGFTQAGIVQADPVGSTQMKVP